MWQELGDSHPRLDTGGDPAVAALAIVQHGPVSVAQLRAAGLRDDAIKHRVRRGRLHRVHRGVYAVGHPRLDARGRLWAALLACGGPGHAVACLRSAAAWWDLLPEPKRPDVATLRNSRSTAAIRVHRLRDLKASDLTTQPDGLRLTTPTRTLIDLAAILTRHRLERVCHRAEMLRLLDTTALGATRSRPGAANLRAALTTLAGHDPDITRSDLEERFLALVAHAGLPRPRVNARVNGYEVDFWWPEHRLVVEVDGAGAHLTPTAFQADRGRTNALTLDGVTVLRFTYADVTARRRHVATQVSRALRV